MIKSIGKMTLAGLLAAVVLGMPVRVSAQDKPTEKPVPSAPAAGATAKAVPFKGKISVVDKAAKTITLDDKNKRVFLITSETKMMKGDKPATLDDGVVGELVTGSYHKGDDGKLSAKSVYFGGKPSEGDAKKKKKEATDAIAK
jgi:hypothetical protein